MNFKFTTTALALTMFACTLQAQHAGEFANMGAVFKVETGAIVSVHGDVHNIGGTLNNDGLIEVQGNLYGDNTFQQRGIGTIRLENNDVNIGERQFISGSYAVRGGQAAIGVDDGSFYNLELANTADYVYLVGAGNIADVRNTVDFLPGGASGAPNRNSIITHDVGMTGAITYPANGSAYTGTFGMMNSAGGLGNFVNNTATAFGNMSGTDAGYVIGKLRRAIAAGGGNYGYVVGLEPAGATAARGLQYVRLDMGANTYDVIEGYFEQGSLNNAAVATECSGYQMDDFWGDRHGEWALNDIGGVMGGDYDVVIWPQDPTAPWSGTVYTISKDDQFAWAAPNPLHNDCGPTPVALDRGPFNGFSDFGVVSASVFVPIDLLYLTATPINNTYIRVDWATAQEDNVDYFEIQRSLDGLNFTTIATEDAVGNSTTAQYYSYDDYNVLPGIDYYYRINTIDNDGTSELTYLVVASIQQDGDFQAVNLYPNPIGQGDFTVDIKTRSEMPVELRVFDAIGQLIYTEKIDSKIGVNSLTIDAQTWASGTYFVQVVGNDLNEVKELIKATH